MTFWTAIWDVIWWFLTIFVFVAYLIARGRGMAERAQKEAVAAQSAADDYIRSVSGNAPTPSAEIAHAKDLLDSGAITQDEFEKLKQSALSRA